MAKTKFDNIKNRVLLVVIVFLLSYLLTALIDKEYTGHMKKRVAYA